MLKLVIADETQENVNELVEKLTAAFPGLPIVTTTVGDTEFVPIKKSGSGTIMLQSAREVHFIPVTQIVRVMGDNNYSVFTLASGQKITVARTLREYESVLEHHHFYRIHKSHIINLHYLVKVNKGDDFSVLMSDGAGLDVAFRRRADFLKLMQERCVS